MKKDWFSIIIPVFNVESFIVPCLTSVFKSKYKKFQLIVVDDCSTDSTVSIIKKFQSKYKNLMLIQNIKNSGPSESRNKAIKRSNTEYIYFLDSDTEVDPLFLQKIEKVFRNQKGTGAVQSLLLDYKKRQIIQNAGLKLVKQTGMAIGLQEGEPLRKAPTSPTEIVGLSAAMAVRTSVFKDGVNFDKAFFHYSEDLDFSWRIWIAGYKIYLAPDSRVYHMVKQMSDRANVGANKQLVTFHLVKNSLRSFTKNYEISNFILYFPQCVFFLLMRSLLVLLVRRDSSSLIGTLRAFYWYTINFSDTLLERRRTQTVIRKVSDSAFMDTIMVKENILQVYRKYFAQTKLLPI